ncbi:DUF4365 domain-containing protein [Streptomyces sp. NPDC048279]|uniref:DUF4365 domain-containing protein n=1 Tax=Streptomyces sp. NPDC048279 TaxID=3154714 RepID=UPI003425F60A
MTTVRPTHLVDRAGVSAVSLLAATELGWLFREQETSDVGVDAHLEVVTGASIAARTTGTPTGRLLAVQIKSGESQFTAVAEGGWWYPCDAAHVAYWRNHSLPVTLLLFDPRTKRVHWQHVTADTLVSTGKHYKVLVPVDQQINQANAEALGQPARLEDDIDPFREAADRLPGDTRIQLLREHQAGAAYAFPLAAFLADAGDPAEAVSQLLNTPPHWLTALDAEREEGAWRAVAAYGSSHEVGLPAVTALERAAAVAGNDRGRLLALAALLAATHASERAERLADAAQEEGAAVLVAAARALMDSGGRHPARLPDVVERALAAGDPAAVKDVNILRFTAHCHFAADCHEEGEDMLERALRLDPNEPAVQLELAHCLLRRSAVGAPRQAFFDISRAERLAQAARAEYRRWQGPSARAASVLLEARAMSGDITTAIHTAIAMPEGDAHESEAESQPLMAEAVRLAYRAGRIDLAETLAARITGHGEKLQLAAYASEADPAADRADRIAAWQAAAAGAATDDQRTTAAFALTGHGIWPVPDLEDLRAQRTLPEVAYQTRWAVADAANGEYDAAIRRLREWENHSLVAAMTLVDQYACQEQLVLAAQAAERAGQRFGDTHLRVLAIDLWDRSGNREQARIKALTLLGRPYLAAGTRSQLRRVIIQWAQERADWDDMEEHSLVGLAEEAGIERITSLEGAAGSVSAQALPLVWAAIHAQLNARKLETARDTLARFAPQIRNAHDARAWLTLTGWSGWTVALAETAIGLAERYRTEDSELAGALLNGVLLATGAPTPDTDPSPRAQTDDSRTLEPVPTALALPDPLSRKLQDLLALATESRSLTAIHGTQNLLQYVEQTLGPREPLLQAAADAVRVGALTTGMLAWAAQRPVALTMIHPAAGLIPACTLNPNHVAAEVRAAHDALNGTAVLDPSTLALTTLLPGRFDQLRAVFAATPVPRAVFDDIIKTRYALDELLRSSGQLGVRGGRSVITKYSDQDREEHHRQAAAFSRIIPALRPVDVPDLTEIRRRLALQDVPDHDVAAWLSAAQHALNTGTPVWCDDATLRELLLKAGIPTFGTVALLRLLTDHSDYPEYTPERYRRDLRILHESYVVDLPVTMDEIIDLAQAQDWRAAAAAAMFARPHFWTIEPLRPRWTRIAEKVWENAPDQIGHWLHHAITGATALLAPQDMLPAVTELTAETLLATGVGPEPAQALLPAALEALETCSNAATRQRTLSRQPAEPLQLPTPAEFQALLRPAVTRLLTAQHRFAPALAAAIADTGLPKTPSP